LQHCLNWRTVIDTKEPTVTRDNIHLLVIDPQNDFCDLPESWRPVDAIRGGVLSPSLPVSGAHADMQRLASLIDDGGAGLRNITVTLDSHQRLDIAHPGFWRRGDGGDVAAFTPITGDDVRNGRFHPRRDEALPRVLAYLDQLEARGRYTLMVWPVHCEVGSWGHGIHAAVRNACNRWEEQQLCNVEKVLKGMNPWTEHYSALMAEVPDPLDEGTQLNRSLLDRLGDCDWLLIAGEASSHCVKATTEDIVANLPSERRARITLLTDCCSAVTGFEAQQREFFETMQARGVQLAHSTDVLPQLQANARS
jgi:nicotinamidase/pyrazinamidase